jgi:hypothetical protein
VFIVITYLCGHGTSCHDAAAEQYARAVDSRFSGALYNGHGLPDVLEFLSTRRKEHLSVVIVVVQKVFD